MWKIYRRRNQVNEELQQEKIKIIKPNVCKRKQSHHLPDSESRKQEKLFLRPPQTEIKEAKTWLKYQAYAKSM